MIHYIKGTLIEKGTDYVVVEANGMGYYIASSFSSIASLPALHENVKMYTEMIVREDAISLVGFAEQEELKMFQLLVSVSGVGTKVGIGILSNLSIGDLLNAIQNHDVKRMTSAPGVGKKTAERLILELKDKVSKLSWHSVDSSDFDMDPRRYHSHELSGQAVEDALEGLMGLGYTQQEAKKVLGQLNLEGLKTEEILKMALRQMMSQ